MVGQLYCEIVKLKQKIQSRQQLYKQTKIGIKKKWDQYCQLCKETKTGLKKEVGCLEVVKNIITQILLIVRMHFWLRKIKTCDFGVSQLRSTKE